MSSLNLTLPPALLNRLQAIWRYRQLLFIIFVAGLSAYLLLQINSAINVAPSSSSSAAVPVTPRLNTAVVKQLQQLQDNSVSVRTLFNQARDNPFQ